MKYRKVLSLIVFVAAVGVFVFAQPSQVNNSTSVVEETARVIRVIDGDTVEVRLNNEKETVRLIGIDSPEVLDERRPIQCFGKEASSKAREVLTGKIIVLEPDSTQGERDKYGRLLRYVFLEDGTNFNKFMLSEGYAHEYMFKSNSYKYQSEFIQAEEIAQGNKKGLWADNICN